MQNSISMESRNKLTVLKKIKQAAWGHVSHSEENLGYTKGVDTLSKPQKETNVIFLVTITGWTSGFQPAGILAILYTVELLLQHLTVAVSLQCQRTLALFSSSEY